MRKTYKSILTIFLLLALLGIVLFIFITFLSATSFYSCGNLYGFDPIYKFNKTINTKEDAFNSVIDYLSTEDSKELKRYLDKQPNEYKIDDIIEQKIRLNNGNKIIAWTFINILSVDKEGNIYFKIHCL